MEKILAGYARVCITPDHPVHISGYNDDEVRLSQGVRDDIYLTCIAVTSGEDTILLYTLDLISFREDVTEKLRAAITEATGIPGEKVFVGATHSHSGPTIYEDLPGVAKFRELVYAAGAAAAVEALADRAPARFLSTTQRIPGMNFIRHYIREDGTYTGSGFSSSDAERIGHVGVSDPRMVLLQFRREDKPSIVLMNWQAHNDNVREVGYYLLSSSFAGHVRSRFEAQTGMHFAYFNGASGNQNRDSLIPEEKHGLNYIDYGHKMADHAIAALPKLKPVKGTEIKTLRVGFQADIDHSWDPKLKEANEVFDLWKRVGKKEGDELGKTYGFTSSYQAMVIGWRAEMEKHQQLELNAFQIGEIGFITGTFEMYSDTGIYTRAYAPYDTVFIITGNRIYVPNAVSYHYRSYEADCSLFAQGTCEKISGEYVRMLEQLKTM